MSKKKIPTGIVNRRARYDYELKKTYLAGIALSGAEAKSLRSGHGHLRGAFVNIKDGELWLNNATITPTKTNHNSLTEDQQTRTRKLLVKKHELEELRAAKDQYLTIVPTKLITASHYIKIEIATARGLKKYDKRANIKKRDTEREINRQLKR